MVGAGQRAAMNGGCVRNSKVIEDLEPQAVWQHFVQLANIPRGSRNEEAVLTYIKSVALVNGLSCNQDARGNMLVKRPASGVGEGKPTVMLQGHVDMVTISRQGSSHDFKRDPVSLRWLGDEFIGSVGTTLGADNGIGCAIMLAILQIDGEVSLPPLEFLFTVEEESGLDGARALDVNALDIQARMMMNLDADAEFGTFILACAGGGLNALKCPVEVHEITNRDDFRIYKVSASNFLGGHSGVDIDKGRGNATQILAACILDVLIAVPEAELLQYSGTTANNAIPHEASALIAMPMGNELALKTATECVQARCAHACNAVEMQAMLEIASVDFATEWRVDPKLGGQVVTKAEMRRLHELEVSGADLYWESLDGSTDSQAPRLTKLDRARVQSLLQEIVNIKTGVIKKSEQFGGVDFSNNIFNVDMPSNTTEIIVEMTSRMRLDQDFEDFSGECQTLAASLGGLCMSQKFLSGWSANPQDSIITSVLCRVVRAMLPAGKRVTYMSVHGGLETGVLCEKLPGLDTISFGPTIPNIHTPDEKVEVASVLKCFALVKATLEEIAEPSLCEPCDPSLFDIIFCVGSTSCKCADCFMK